MALTLQQRAKTFKNNNGKVKIGKYKGWSVNDVPTDYIKWYLSNYDITKKRTSFSKYEQRTVGMFINELERRNKNK